jgi:selenocysteine-specific translation elongation factor
MPIPKPKQNEDKQKFVGRCMGNETMKKDYPNVQQRIAICLGQTKQKGKSNLLAEVQDELFAKNCSWDDEWDEFVWEIEATEIYDENDKVIAAEKNKKVKLNKPMRTPDGPKKFSVYVKNDKGNTVKVNFGDPNMEIKRDDPERRKNFRARHNCDNPGPKWKARYWSCKFWSRPNVSDLT